MTDPNYTDILLIVDRSGSMGLIQVDAEGGINAFLDEQKKGPGRCTVTLAEFDHEYTALYTSKPVAEVPAYRLQPRGTTALLDAIGRALTETGRRLASLAENERPGNVVVVIQTDGLENASQEWTRERVLAAVTEQIEKYGWTFTYLGANQDAIAVGTGLGIPAGNSLTFDSMNVAVATASASNLTNTVRRNESWGGYADDERARAGTP
jgi:Mg-chelatase subunit ChlD